MANGRHPPAPARRGRRERGDTFGGLRRTEKTIENRDVEDDLGLSVESPDAITWTVKLRPGASFPVADKMYTVSGLPQPRVHTLVQPWVQNFQFAVPAAVATESYTKLWIAK